MALKTYEKFRKGKNWLENAKIWKTAKSKNVKLTQILSKVQFSSQNKLEK